MTSPILDELLQRTKTLRALARDLVGDAAADDIVQETAIQALTAPPQRPGSVGGWLAAVVRHLASKQRRSERIRRHYEAHAARAEAEPPSRSAEDVDTLRRLTEIVTSLPEPYRATILARYLRERTPTEIAADTDTPVRTVKTRLQRGLALLREKLGAQGGDWRALLIGTFALETAVTPKGSTLLGTTMKLALLAAVLLPTGFAIWNSAAPSTSTPTDNGIAATGSSMLAGASTPATVIARGGVGDRELVNEPDREDAPDPLPISGPPIEPDPTLAGPARNRDLLAESRGHDSTELRATAPLMRLDAVGPAAFRAAFANTDIGRLFASEGGERLWRPLLAPAERIWQQWDGGGDDFQATRQRVLAFAGRIRVLWMVQPGEADESERVFGVFAMDTDGSSDLAALAGDLSRAMVGFLPDSPTQRTVGEHELRVIGEAGGDFVTIPTVVGGCLVAFFGEAGSLDQTVPLCLAALATDAEPPSAPLSLHIDLAQLRGLHGMRTEPTIAKLLGMESLRSLEATVRPNGVHAQLDVEVVFGDGDRGVLAGFMPPVGTLPKLLSLVPAEATPWLAVPFRPDVMLRAGLEAAAAEDGHEGGIETVRQEMYDELGLHIDTDLFDHLRGEVMVLGDLWQSDDPGVFRRGDDPPLGACIAWSLQDSAAFGRGLDKLLDYMKGHVHRHESREVDGVKVTRLGSMFLTGMHMAVGRDLFAMGFGKEGVTQLEALVAGAGQAGARPLPAAVQSVRHLAPAGWNGVGLADLTALFGGQVTLVLELVDDTLPPPMRFGSSLDETQAWLDRLLPLIETHDLDHLVTMTGYDNGHWRLRLLW